MRGAIKVSRSFTSRLLGNVTRSRGKIPDISEYWSAGRRGQVDHDFRHQKTGAKPGPRPPFLGCFWGFVQVPGPQHRYSVLSLAVRRLGVARGGQVISVGAD